VDHIKNINIGFQRTLLYCLQKKFENKLNTSTNTWQWHFENVQQKWYLWRWL